VILPGRHNPFNLTPREYDVAELTAKGLSGKEVAERLKISKGTVNYLLVSRIYPKCRVRSHAGLIRVWIIEAERRGDCGACLLRQAQLVVIGEA